MISLKNVSFSYNRSRQIIKNISFDIDEGECVVLLGPNGVGKTTLIKCLLGLYKLDEGEILFNERSLKSLSSKEKAKYVSYVPQLIEGNALTVSEIIMLGRLPFYQLYPSKNDYEKVKEMILKFHLENIKDSRSDEISGGERQKMSIARGLIQEAKLVVFDEPTSNLDIKNQLDILSFINEQKQHNQSFLISMQDINQALSIGDRFLFLKEGEVFALCSKKDITSKLIDEVYQIKSKITEIGGDIYVTYENQ